VFQSHTQTTFFDEIQKGDDDMSSARAGKNKRHNKNGRGES
jgi:hypothetical protein